MRERVERLGALPLTAKRHPRAAWLVLAATMLVAVALVLIWSGDRTFVIDEWGYLVDRSHWSAENLLRPTIGHLIALGLVLYNAAFSAFGAESHLPLTLITIALQCLVAGLVYAYAARRVGAWIALLPAILVLFYGAGWEILISSATLPNQVATASGIGMLLALDRRDRAGDLAACLMLVISLASFTIGLAFAVAGGIRLLLERGGGGGLRRLGVVVVPLALYVIWFGWALKYHQGDFSAYSIGAMPSAVFDQVNAGLAGITGLFRVVGRPSVGDAVVLDVSRTTGLVFLLAAAVGWRIVRGPRLRPEAWATLGLVGVYLLLVGLGLSDGRRPDASRYVYMLTVLLMLAGADLLAGLRIARAWVYAAAAGPGGLPGRQRRRDPHGRNLLRAGVRVQPGRARIPRAGTRDGQPRLRHRIRSRLRGASLPGPDVHRIPILRDHRSLRLARLRRRGDRLRLGAGAPGGRRRPRLGPGCGGRPRPRAKGGRGNAPRSTPGPQWGG